MNGAPNEEKYPPPDTSSETPLEDAPKDITPEKVPKTASKASSEVTTENISPKTPVKDASSKPAAKAITPEKICAGVLEKIKSFESTCKGAKADADKSQTSSESTSQSESVEVGSEYDSLEGNSEGGSLEFPSEGELSETQSEESLEASGVTKGCDETGKAESVKALEKTCSEISGKDTGVASSERELSEGSYEAQSGSTKGFDEAKSSTIFGVKSPEKRLPRLNRRSFQLGEKLFESEMNQPEVKKTDVGIEKCQLNVPVQKKMISLVSVKKTPMEVKLPKEGKIILKRKASSSFDEEEKTKSPGATTSSGAPQKKKYKPITWP